MGSISNWRKVFVGASQEYAGWTSGFASHETPRSGRAWWPRFDRMPVAQTHLSAAFMRLLVGGVLVKIVCLDLEGVLVPEIWIAFSERSGIPELRRTTRDEPDYDVLMKYRLRILAENGLKLPDIQNVIGGMHPLPGAREFLDRLREKHQVVILSDTFYEFARPLMRQLAWPTLFCHSLEIDAEGRVFSYRLRMRDQKRQAVRHFRELNFTVVAGGDSYNDIGMLGEAHAGVLFRPPENVAREFPQYPITRDYDAFFSEIESAFERVDG
jgi:phosphoserine/homoserine phosphotransferase